MFLRKLDLHSVRQIVFNLVCIDGRVQQERSAFLESGSNVILQDIGIQGTGYEVSVVYIVCASDRIRTESQVRSRDTAGFSGVILEISLCILIRVVADDLDGVLVGTDSTVGTQTPEQTGRVCSVDLEVRIDIQRQMSDIIVDTDREFLFRSVFLQFVKDGFDLVRSSILGSDTVTSADQLDACVFQDAQDIKVQRFSRTDLFGSIENRDFLDGLR